MEFHSPEFFVTTDQSRFDFAYICRSLQTTPWAKERSDAVILESFRQSIGFGLFARATGAQLGFARVITDQVTRSFIEDVFIDEAHRHRGLGKWLMACVVSHPAVANTKSRLATADAHGFYEKFGYVREEVMRRLPGAAG
jgi:GNAT superfamily N-acetyltransferase